MAHANLSTLIGKTTRVLVRQVTNDSRMDCVYHMSETVTLERKPNHKLP